MNLYSLTTTPVLALGLALLPASAERPQFAPKEGLELTRTYEYTLNAKSAPMRFLIDGKELPEGGPQVTLTLEQERKIEFRDAFAKVGDGRAEKLERSFETIRGTDTTVFHTQGDEGDGEDEEEEKELTSSLEGKKVRFTWDEESEEHELAFVEEGDESLLEGLEIDADFTGILPPKDVEEGAEWTFDAKVLGNVDEPSGDLHLAADGEDEDEHGELLDKELDENVKGKFKAIWRGVTEEGGRKLGRIEISGEISTEADVEHEGARRVIKTEAEYTGEAWWDLEGGHLAKLELREEFKGSFTFSETMEGPEGEALISQSFDLTGEATHLLTVKR